MNTFKAIIFDFGGVIELSSGGDILQEIATIISTPLDQVVKTYHQYNHLTNVQNMKWEDAAMEMVRVFNKDPEIERRVREAVHTYAANKTINTELCSLFSPLREAGLKIGILSNYTTALRIRLEEQGILPLVDDVVISAEIGHQKPDREAFNIAFERLKVRPEEVIFVDDSPKSLEKAGEIGYQPILFQSNEQLKDDLLRLGIDI